MLIGVCVFGAALGTVRFVPELPWEYGGPTGPLCRAYCFHVFRFVAVENQMNYSLGTAVVFPAIFLYGIGAGILISLLAAFADFIRPP